MGEELKRSAPKIAHQFRSEHSPPSWVSRADGSPWRATKRGAQRSAQTSSSPAGGAGGAGVPSPGVSAAEPARRPQCLHPLDPSACHRVCQQAGQCPCPFVWVPRWVPPCRELGLPPLGLLPAGGCWGAAGNGGSAQRGTHGGDTRPCPARNLRPRGSGRFSCTLLGRFLRRHKPGSLQIPLRWGRRCTGVPSDPNHSPPAPGVPVSLGVTPPLQSSQGQCAAKGSTPPPTSSTHQQWLPAPLCPLTPLGAQTDSGDVSFGGMDNFIQITTTGFSPAFHSLLLLSSALCLGHWQPQ